MNQSKLLREYVKHLMLELRHQGFDSDALSDWAKKGGYYIHFGNHKNVGIPPTSQYSETPSGVYAYPLTPRILLQYENGELHFAGEREYIHVLTPKRPERFFHLEKMSAPVAETLIKRVEQVSKKQFSEFESLVAVSTFRFPGEKFWKFSRWVCMNPFTDNRAWRDLLLKIGVDGAEDTNGVIYRESDQPEQAVFLGKNVINHVATIVNNASRFLDLVKLTFLQEVKKLFDEVNDEPSLNDLFHNWSRRIVDAVVETREKHKSLEDDDEESARSYRQKGKTHPAIEFDSYVGKVESMVKKILQRYPDDPVKAKQVTLEELTNLEKTLNY